MPPAADILVLPGLIVTALIPGLQQLIDGVEAIIKFFQSDVGLSWGLAIVALTFTVRLALLPLSLRGIRSMRRMQLVAPQMKALQEKYKDDRERMQRELMQLYQKEGINPFSSCLPLLIQIPFFIAIYQLLRGSSFADDVKASGADQGFLFVKSVIEKPDGVEAAILIVLFIVTTVLTFLYTMSTTQTTSGAQRYIFLALPVFIAPFIISAPAGLAVYWITTNVWSLGQQVLVQQIMPAPTPPTPEEVKATKAPPPPPRKRKRRRR